MDEAMASELKRLDEENVRQNHRLTEIEEAIKNQQDMIRTIDKLALNIEAMQKEMVRQGDRLCKLESKPVETWSSIKRVAMNVATTAITSLIVGGIIWAAVQAYLK